jgi:cytochrome c553
MLVPTQSHAMTDVGYHWTNLWFAAEQKNWPLAEFYFTEARQHIQWSILIRPVRKDPEGRDVDLTAIFNALDVSAFATMKLAIAKKDSAQFVDAYKQGLEGCYACHKASGKSFLRPTIPRAPAQSIIDFAPGAGQR